MRLHQRSHATVTRLSWWSILFRPKKKLPRSRTPWQRKKKQALDLQGLASGGDSWTRTNDPIDVNDVHWATGQVVKLKCGREHT